LSSSDSDPAGMGAHREELDAWITTKAA
jgi:hypothetical protein